MLGKNPIFFFKGDDSEILEAYKNAQKTFKYYLREWVWETRRIVPALSIACVKTAFTDDEQKENIIVADDVEHMWINNIKFDGEFLYGTLINQPSHLKSVKLNDVVKVPFYLISDWLYSNSYRVFGGFTIQLMRSKMSREERINHDDAWGLKFGNPNKVNICYSSQEEIFDFTNYHKSEDHPMSINMGVKLLEQIKKDKEGLFSYRGFGGFSMLHEMAMAGSAVSVQTLLSEGIDPLMKTKSGKTAKDLAELLNWHDVLKLL